jgi:hypothetical protein
MNKNSCISAQTSCNFLALAATIFLSAALLACLLWAAILADSLSRSCNVCDGMYVCMCVCMYGYTHTHDARFWLREAMLRGLLSRHWNVMYICMYVCMYVCTRVSTDMSHHIQRVLMLHADQEMCAFRQNRYHQHRSHKLCTNTNTHTAVCTLKRVSSEGHCAKRKS